MTAIGPGDWVERDPGYESVEDAIARSKVVISGEWPTFGRVYCIRDMRTLRSLTGRRYQGLRLVGIVASIPRHLDAFWPASAFRPIYRPKVELIEQLLKPAEERVGEDA